MKTSASMLLLGTACLLGCAGAPESPDDESVVEAVERFSRLPQASSGECPAYTIAVCESIMTSGPMECSCFDQGAVFDQMQAFDR